MPRSGWTSPDERERGSQPRTRLVSEPIEHQGLRTALRDAYGCGRSVPGELETLLRRIR